MLIDNVVSLTFGTLQNRPSVRDCHNMVLESSRVKRGDLFIVADEESDYGEAIEKGAYALLYDRDLPVNDHEIAWIRVENVNKAVEKILRHQLLQHHMEIISCERIDLHLLELLNAEHPPFLMLYATSLSAMVDAINACHHNALLLIDAGLLQSATQFPTCQSLNISITSALIPFETSLFQSSFLFDGRYYAHERIAPFLLPYLERALNFLKSRNRAYSMSKLAALHHFEPLFLNRALHKQEFGSSERVIIFENDTALFAQAHRFIKQHGAWGRIAVMTPNEFTIEHYDGVEYLTFDHEDAIIPQLHTLEFNFLLLLQKHTFKQRFAPAETTSQLTLTL